MTAFTLFHVVLSLIGILSGFVVTFGLINGKRLSGWTSLFLTTTVATSATGFLFPYHGFKPSYVVGTVSLLVLAIAIFALYGRGLAGAWRKTYIVSSLLALYLNVFVLIAQLFMKVPALKTLAPTQSEPPFLVSQVVVVLIFVALGFLASKRFRAEVVQAA